MTSSEIKKYPTEILTTHLKTRHRCSVILQELQAKQDKFLINKDKYPENQDKSPTIGGTYQRFLPSKTRTH